MIYGEPPWELDLEQLKYFEGYHQYKIRNWRPIEMVAIENDQYHYL